LLRDGEAVEGQPSPEGVRLGPASLSYRPIRAVGIQLIQFKHCHKAHSSGVGSAFSIHQQRSDDGPSPVL